MFIVFAKVDILKPSQMFAIYGKSWTINYKGMF